MNTKKRLLFALMLCALMVFPTEAFASDGDYIIDIPNVSMRFYNSSVTFDFDTYYAWGLYFDNDAFAVWNHRYVTVSYDSCTPSNAKANVKIELYVDDDDDGNYELADSDGGYTYQLVMGDYIKIELPLGNTVANYLLRISNQTASVKSGEFTVTTSRS